MIKTFALRCVPALALLGLLFFALVYLISQAEGTRNTHRQTLAINYSINACGNSIEGELHDTVEVLSALANSSELQGFIKRPTASNSESVAGLFSAYLEKKNYQQVRFLDASGQEIIRVDYKSGIPHRANALQDKSARYYFREGIKTPAGEFFMSPIDFNMEHGEIQRPLQPVFRLASPVYDSAETLWGLVIINVNANRIMRLLQRSCGNLGQLLVYNHDGQILYDTDKQEMSQFELNSLTRIQNLDPQAWQHVSNHEALFTSNNVFWATREIELEAALPKTGLRRTSENLTTQPRSNLSIAVLDHMGQTQRLFSNGYILTSSIGIAILVIWLSIVICHHYARRNPA